MDWGFDNTFARKLDWLGAAVDPVPVSAPSLLTVNDSLALELGLDPQWLASTDGVAHLAGNAVPEGAQPRAQAYAGHQFGQFSPLLGDGRAHLLGEVVDAHGARRDLGLKGSGRTPFSRGGDGRAALGPVLRELIVSEAMHALGIPTTRVLAAVATGEQILRADGPTPGAVLTRVAASHLRVGTAELVRMRASDAQQLAFADYVRRRHHPQVAEGDHLGLIDAVVEAQASLIARWMSVGFIHGVMNTDNMTLSGETIDYGPCAFLEAHDPNAVFSSIDTMGRYRFGAQPSIAQWNLARYAETLLPLLAPDPSTESDLIEAATERIRAFETRFRGHWLRLHRGKLGLPDALSDTATAALTDDLLAIMIAERLDHTRTFRLLATVLRGADRAVADLVDDSVRWLDWQSRWLADITTDPQSTADAMDRVNPAYLARNHLVEEALAAAATGDLAPTEALLDVLRDPFTVRPGLDRYAAPAPASFTAAYVTFCGT
ncbi:MAG TPA: YdiU family protein [Phycicoccus elongatus]|nr:YdiU family protein [Phycicoccus elongatus]